jgi:cell wall-associated NlpC family hydrolase
LNALIVPLNVDEQRRAVAGEAASWIGTSYHHHARIKGVGVDCAQLLCAVFETVGLVPPIDTGHYPVDWHLHHSEEIFSHWLTRYAHLRSPGAAPQIGDILLFQFGRTFSHGSIVVGRDSDGTLLLVHSYVKRGVILSRLTEDPLAGRALQHWSLWPHDPVEVPA